VRALLLAAGRGTRLRPLTDTIPKCLVPIRGVPLLGLWLDRLFEAGVERAVVNTHYLPEPVRAFVAASRWRERIELFHEDTLLGTGGTMRAVRDRLGEAPLVAHADNLTEIDVQAFARAHAQRPAGTELTMALFETDAPQTCGIVELDAQQRVVRFHEKVPNPPGNLANAAVYVAGPEVFRRIEALGKPVVDLSTEILPGMMGRIYTYRLTGYHRDIGSPAALAAAERDMAAAHG
jgi:mannose-1-phosphate guanylyltransferase